RLTRLLYRHPVPPSSAPFPYTTLFRSAVQVRRQRRGAHDAHPPRARQRDLGAAHVRAAVHRRQPAEQLEATEVAEDDEIELAVGDRKSTRLNSSHQIISYAVFCLKKKK